MHLIEGEGRKEEGTGRKEIRGRAENFSRSGTLNQTKRGRAQNQTTMLAQPGRGAALKKNNSEALPGQVTEFIHLLRRGPLSVGLTLRRDLAYMEGGGGLVGEKTGRTSTREGECWS